MKKTFLLFSLLLATLVSSTAQTVELTFTANSQEGLYCPFDAVNVTNITRGWTETLVYPDTVLVLTSTVGLTEKEETPFRLGEAYPNPFTDETHVCLEMHEASVALLQVVGVDGAVLASNKMHLEAGMHRVTANMSQSQMAFLVVTTTQGRQVSKLVCLGNGGRNSVTVETLSTEPKSGIKSEKGIATHDFERGDMMRYTAVLFEGINTLYSNTIIQQQYESQIVTLFFNFALPEVTTNQVTDITQTTAICGGNVTIDGGAAVTERGICWGETQNPTINGQHANSGTGLGSYTIYMTGLTPNTTYYVRAYAMNSVGPNYGEQHTFTTIDLTVPIVQTLDVTNITQTTAKYCGVVISDGGTTVTARGHCWSTSPNPTVSIENSYSIVSGETGNYYTHTHNLTAETTYYVRAYATNSVGTAYGAQETFTTLPPPPTGAIGGVFSVEPTTYVYFSQGNLQYQASTQTWRFASHQYDVAGSSANSGISQNNSEWIDLFGWGTSGWNCGNTYYRPWDSNNSDYSLYGPPGSNNLSGNYANSDWGRYNAISNGGNQTGQWRTLTDSEWRYVLFHRNTSSGIRYAKAQVAGVNGIILLPDDWSTGTYSLSNTNTSGASFTSNVISASQWTTLENAGAVFLPAAGRRYGTSVSDVGSNGYYWSASYYSSNNAYHVIFDSSILGMSYYGGRCFGQSVRLVCPAGN